MQGLEIEEDIKCSACGKQFDIWDKQEDFSFDKHIGYGSKYDEKHIKFQLCCDCFDKIFDKVKPMIINIQIEDCDAWAGEKAVDIDAEYLEKITIKNESLEKLIALNEKIFMLFTQYFINYYKYNHLEFMLYSDKNRDYKAEILNLILEAKQSVELTENDYNQSLFFNGFSAKIDEFTFKLVKILSKMQYKEPIFAFLSNENYLKIFIDYYNCVADEFSKELASQSEISYEELEEIFNNADEILYCNDPDDEKLTDEQINFSKEMINLIQSYVHIEDTLNKFSKNSFNDYYEKYCLANDKNRESTTEKVYYNFHNKDKYRNYCDEFAGLVKSEKICLYHFFDIHTTIKYFKFLLRRTGCIDKNLLLTLSEPAFHNNDGDVIIGLHAFSYVTQNYGKLCIDFIIYGRNLRPISMYPLDVEEFERKFKLICDKYEK